MAQPTFSKQPPSSTLAELAAKAPSMGGPIGAGVQLNTEGAEGGFEVEEVIRDYWDLGVRHIDIPITPQKVWAILHENGIS